MTTLTTTQTSGPDPEPVDDGLRSVQGIRWLLLAGGLVVAVSVIRLVAAEWGMLPTAARFLTLTAGALAVFAAGDVARRRLALPVAGAALLSLGTALVPLLAWGAAYLHLLEAPFGWPSLMLGLGALLAAADRALRSITAYRGAAYTMASGIMLFALPILPFFEAHWPWSREGFFLTVAATLGLLLRGTSRHINRFFFHRDRLSGLERPVHWLPFAVLILLYGAAMSLLSAFATHLAVPLVFIAIALIDAGEEYYRALIRATGEKPEGWPKRSLALLALGFTALVASMATAPLDAGHHSLALVATLASLRLFAWAWRYGHLSGSSGSGGTAAHTAGLLSSIVAYHTIPALVPDTVRELFQRMLVSLDIGPGGLGALSLGDLGMVAMLMGIAWFLRRLDSGQRFTPAMQQVHAAITAFCTSLVLLISLTDPFAARLVAPAAATLLAIGVFGFRWKAAIPAFYQALVTSALAWAWSPTSHAGLLSTQAVVWLGIVHLIFLGAGYLALRRLQETAPGDGVQIDRIARIMTWPPLGVAFGLLLRAFAIGGSDPGAAGVLSLVATVTFALSALILRRPWMAHGASLSLAAGIHCLAAAGSSQPILALAITSQVLMVAYWIIAAVLENRESALAQSIQSATRLGFVACAEVGLLWLLLAFAWGLGTSVCAVHLALLAGLLIVEEVLTPKRQASAQSSAFGVTVAEGWEWWRLRIAFVMLFVWVPIQAAGSGAEWLTLEAMGWLVLAVATSVGAKVLSRRDRADLAPMFRDTALLSGMTAGAASILATLDTSRSVWLSILPAFLASVLFVLMAAEGYRRKLSAALAMSYFALSSHVLLLRLETWGPELYCLGPGLALLGLTGLLRRELDPLWRQRLFTGGATLLYAMPLIGLLDELNWGWQIVLLLLAVAFGAASFVLRSRSLLTVSTAAMVIDLACFLIKLRQTAPLLVWVAGIVFGLGLMAIAALLEHRREVLLQRIRIWGQELRSWA